MKEGKSLPMTNTPKAIQAQKTPLERMKAALERQVATSNGVDNLSVRMLRAEIYRYEQALKEGTKTQAEQWMAGGGPPGR